MLLVLRSMLVRERAMSSGWPAALQSERRQHDLMRVIVLLALQYAVSAPWGLAGLRADRASDDNMIS